MTHLSGSRVARAGVLRFFAALLMLGAGIGCQPALAQPYPSRPVKLIVPFPAGGATDIFARTLSQKMGDRLGQAVVVENRPGAGGTLGSDLAAKAPPDGYTLLLATSSTHAIAPALNAHMPYDAARDFTPVAHVGNAPSIMLVPNSASAKTLRDWVAYAKQNPGRLNFASSGNGTIVHLTGELFKAQAGLFIVHIPYKGTALAIPDLVSGKIDVMFDSLPSGLPHVRDGRLRALAVTSAKRTAMAPDLPAVAELFPGFESNTWFGLYGPKGLPADVLAKIETAVNQTLADADVRDRLARLGIEPVGGTPRQFAQMVAADAAKWKKIIQDRKIVSD
jgi:tripartite-type tricarboxylate transporter receptor subunit TctC